MKTLLIAYELAVPTESRDTLVQKIKDLGEAWARPLDTVWLVRTERSEGEVLATLEATLGADDGLIVQAAPTAAGLANATVRWFRHRADEASAHVSAAPACAHVSAAPTCAHVSAAPTGARAPDKVVELRATERPKHRGMGHPGTVVGFKAAS